MAATNPLQFFVYPRLLAGRAPVGYDFGYFLEDTYVVIGNSRTREAAEMVIRKSYEPASIAHETSPSACKSGRSRQAE